MTHTPTTHDYSIRTWGHDYTVHNVNDGGELLDVSGWGRGIRANDYLIMPNGNGTTRYQVSTIKYYHDPSDMWNATLVFAPRKDAS